MKRFFDFIVSLVSLVILTPVLVIVAFTVRMRLGSPILFKQVRPGKGGKLFKMMKFRTMVDTVDCNGNPLPDSARVTPFGHFLRSTSFDELPGLWNVLKGDMSIVGPRPLLVEYLPLYSKVESRRHEVRPGLTGWAQVNGRNAIGWEDKFRLDIWYVDNRSFWLDVKIIFLTIKKVFLRHDINAAGEATISKFTGTKK